MSDFRSLALVGMSKSERLAFERDEARSAQTVISSISKSGIGKEYDGTHTWFSRAV